MLPVSTSYLKMPHRRGLSEGITVTCGFMLLHRESESQNSQSFSLRVGALPRGTQAFSQDGREGREVLKYTSDKSLLLEDHKSNI